LFITYSDHIVQKNMDKLISGKVQKNMDIELLYI